MTPTATDETLDVPADCAVGDHDLVDGHDVCCCTDETCRVCWWFWNVNDERPWLDEDELYAAELFLGFGDRRSRVRFHRFRSDQTADLLAAMLATLAPPHEAMLTGLAELAEPTVTPDVISRPGPGDVDCLVMAPGAPSLPLAA